MHIPHGVYIGKDIETVLTNRYFIVYRRFPDNRQLESLLLNKDMDCIGVCRTTPVGVHPMVSALLDRSVKEIKQQENELQIIFADDTVSSIGTPPENVKSALLKKDISHLSLKGSSVNINYMDGDNYSFTPPEQINWEYALIGDKETASSDEMKGYLSKKLLTITAEDKDSLSVIFNDGVKYTAKAHELFSMDDLSPPRPTTKEASIGECLLKWNVGINDLYYENCFIGVTVNTCKHMYIFEITENSVYCRAARYVTCDKGVVFDQNFRQGFEAYMADDNRVAMENLSYDESNFNTESCIWDGKTVYWSTDEVGETEIKLNGCQGDTYVWSKPN